MVNLLLEWSHGTFWSLIVIFFDFIDSSYRNLSNNTNNIIIKFQYLQNLFLSLSILNISSTTLKHVLFFKIYFFRVLYARVSENSWGWHNTSQFQYSCKDITLKLPYFEFSCIRSFPGCYTFDFIFPVINCFMSGAWATLQI
jgi:hypothetical protein